MRQHGSKYFATQNPPSANTLGDGINRSKVNFSEYGHVAYQIKGAQWLSGRVLDSRPKGRRFEHHQPHCVVVLEQDTFILA